MKRLALITMSLALLQGCGRGGIDENADPDQGGAALRTALEAWKAGKAPEDLEKQSSIIMNEPDWRSGKRLVAFKMDEKGSMRGRQVRWQVQLTTEDKAGAKRDQNAKYIIDTTPRLVIVRDDEA